MRTGRTEAVMDCIVRMAVAVVVGMIMRMRVIMVVHVLMRGTVFMQVVVHVLALCVRVRMVVAVIMIVRGTVGMHVKMSAVAVAMFAVFHGLAVNGCFSCAATAYITHSFSPSLYVEFFDSHLITARHLHLMAAALGAGIVQGRHMHNFGAMQTPRLPGYFDDLQLRIFGNAVAHHRIETELHRLDFHTCQLADLQPYRFDAAEILRLRRIFYQLQNSLRQRHLMHGQLSKSKFRRNTALLSKNYSLHISYMPRPNLLLAPCLA
jgi:hypothetical protein